MTTCAQYIARLEAAETALDKLLTQGKVEVLRDGEKSLTYTRANIADLQNYVERLQAKVDACNGVRSSKKRLIQFTPE